MTHFPFSQEMITSAGKFIDENRVGQVIFSDGTYQIEILDEKEPFWPFLQIGDEGEFRDFFCTCQASEREKECVHLAAAALKIFEEGPLPLHMRFKLSFWNVLCMLAAKRFGFDTNILQKQKGEFRILDASSEVAFSLKIKTKSWEKKTENILINRPVETEENSIKFSKLSEDELMRWKKGNPSFSLRFELSFWADLAKWLFLTYEQNAFTMQFLENHDSLPSGVRVSLEGIEIFFRIYREDWPDVIPSLKSIKSPFEVREFFSLEIREIRYDPKEKCLFLDASKEREERKRISENQAVQIDNWLFKPSEGFYKLDIDPILTQERISEREISSFLQKYGKLVKPFFKKIELHLAPIKAKYKLFFNHEHRLHVCCFAFEEGDLELPLSSYFAPWIFLENKGFYCLEDLLFDGIERIYTRDEVGAFVTQNRAWLNQYEGFRTHLASVESHVDYSLDEKDRLHFKSHLEFFGEEGDIIDFDEWIYLKEKGFYPKASGKEKMHIFPGLKISFAEIPEFIRKYRDELQQVRGFFSSVCPIEKAGLSISINENGRIVIEPEMQFIPPYAALKPKIFEDFIYIKGEGFSEIPPAWKIPLEYVKKREIPEDEAQRFLEKELEQLRRFVSSIDHRLLEPKNITFFIDDLMREEDTKKILLKGHYESEMGNISLNVLMQALENRKSFIISDAGLIYLNSPRFSWLKRLHEREKKEEYFQLSMLEWFRLNTYEEVMPPKGSSERERQTRIILQEIKEHKTHEFLDLSFLKSELRPYQKIGVEWLWFMYCNGLSSFLCDEMGLGKTHEAMALLSGSFAMDTQREKKYLVVCPTSVMYHWEELLKKFLPKVRVLMFYGAQRSLKPFQKRYDLLLTTYGMLRGESKQIWEIPFEVAIFDELQVAKNRLSQTHKALRGIKAKMRLGLTGTPIENRLLELKALFDLILPALLPPESLFRELFIVPIEKYHDEERKHLLSKLVKPFILRRKKSEVLKDLPEKIEEIAYCDLSEEQQKLYKNAYLEAKGQLIKELQEEKTPVPYMHIFSLFSKLKQICDHPSLVYKDTENFHRHKSGKWDLFVELLQEIRESNQKVVVFTQYLDMMDIIENYLRQENVGFAEIRGSTRDRKQQVEMFARDPKCEVFVGSLQAAGVGIDLIAASVVIHYDRWWNPAKEEQATDRVHRIGQKRGVQVFKCVAKDTIEEHIHTLIEKKKGLIEKVIGYDSADELKALTRDEIVMLLHKIDLNKEQI